MNTSPWMAKMTKKQKCGAFARTTGKPCKKDAMKNGSGKCHIHGGKSPKGVASATFKTGIWSKDLPTRLAARFEAARKDPDLLKSEAQIALIDVRVGELLAEIDEPNANTEQWMALQKLMKKYLIASKRGDPEKAFPLLANMEAIIEAAASESQKWTEIFDLFERRRKLQETETKQMVNLQQMFTAAQGLIMIGLIEQVLKRHIDDRNILAAIGHDISSKVVDGSWQQVDS